MNSDFRSRIEAYERLPKEDMDLIELDLRGDALDRIAELAAEYECSADAIIYAVLATLIDDHTPPPWLVPSGDHVPFPEPQKEG